jgi:hypothetical protein
MLGSLAQLAKYLSERNVFRINVQEKLDMNLCPVALCIICVSLEVNKVGRMTRIVTECENVPYLNKMKKKIW